MPASVAEATPATAPVQGAALEAFCREIGPDCEPDLVDPMGETDLEEAYASFAAYAQMTDGHGAFGGMS